MEPVIGQLTTRIEEVTQLATETLIFSEELIQNRANRELASALLQSAQSAAETAGWTADQYADWFQLADIRQKLQAIRDSTTAVLSQTSNVGTAAVGAASRTRNAGTRTGLLKLPYFILGAVYGTLGTMGLQLAAAGVTRGWNYLMRKSGPPAISSEPDQSVSRYDFTQQIRYYEERAAKNVDPVAQITIRNQLVEGLEKIVVNDTIQQAISKGKYQFSTQDLVQISAFVGLILSPFAIIAAAV